jgi:molybdate transport system ATP-binding protein
MKLSLRHIRLPLADFTLEVDVELTAPVTALFGASGAGKTSLLDLIAGLRRAPSAKIVLGERTLTDTDAGVFVATHQRAIGYVPQDLALFPHLSVRRNLLYGHAPNEAASEASLARVLGTLEISELLERMPASLSGGEKQRVALGRALLASPRLLLLDEPLASLDRPLKARLLPYLRRIREEFRIPLVYVTHDREEVAGLCDEVVVLRAGKVLAQGTVEAALPRE